MYQYQHFMALSIAVRILCSNQKDLYHYAHSLLTYFVENFEVFYGRENLSYNVHNLIHLLADVQKFGPLDNFSAFQYETALFKLKTKLRQSHKPLQQIHNRICESYQNISSSFPVTSNFSLEKFVVRDGYSTFKYIHVKNFTLSIDPPDNICVLDNINSFEIIRTQRSGLDIFLHGKEYLNKTFFIEKPDVSKLHILLVSSEHFICDYFHSKNFSKIY